MPNNSWHQISGTTENRCNSTLAVAMTDEPLVSGGGWKQEPGSTPVYIGAIACLVLACGCGFYAAFHPGIARWVTGIAGVLLFVLAIVLSRIEKPLQVPDAPDAGEDPHNLYFAAGGSTKNDGSQQISGGDAERHRAPQS